MNEWIIRSKSHKPFLFVFLDISLRLGPSSWLRKGEPIAMETKQKALPKWKSDMVWWWCNTASQALSYSCFQISKPERLAVWWIYHTVCEFPRWRCFLELTLYHCHCEPFYSLNDSYLVCVKCKVFNSRLRWVGVHHLKNKAPGGLSVQLAGRLHPDGSIWTDGERNCIRNKPQHSHKSSLRIPLEQSGFLFEWIYIYSIWEMHLSDFPFTPFTHSDHNVLTTEVTWKFWMFYTASSDFWKVLLNHQ